MNPVVSHVDGTQLWYREGKLHREDGPAVVFLDGRQEWWREDTKIKETYAATKSANFNT